MDFHGCPYFSLANVGYATIPVENTHDVYSIRRYL
jgi:hypothetical protein